MMKFVFALLVLFNLKFALAQTSDCQVQNIYNAGEKTFVFYNTLLKFSEVIPKSNEEFKNNWNKASDWSQDQCGFKFPLTVSNVTKSTQDAYNLTLPSGVFTLGFKGSAQEYTFFIYKQTGTYAHQPLLLAHYKNSTLDFFRITGRDGKSGSNGFFNFLISKDSIRKFTVDFTDPSDFSSLKTIYKNSIPKRNFNFAVGVIGTGVDYNHPKLAIQMAYRETIEQDVQKLETLKEKLKHFVYTNLQDYLDDQNTFDRLKSTIGFPHWMDPALESVRPFDRIVSERPIPGLKYHETLITSRIVFNSPHVKIFSVRRKMNGKNQKLDVLDIIRRFNNEGVRIVNLSFGSSCGYLPEEEDQWNQVFKAYPHMIFVIAAGNSNKDVNIEPSCPAFYSTRYNNVISVTAADENGLSQYGGVYVNYGMNVDLAIPADHHEVYVPLNYNPSSKVIEPNGASSIATAEVTRILVEAFNEGLTIDPQKVKTQLIQTSYRSLPLIGKVKSSGLVDEQRFKNLLREQTRFKVSEQKL